MYQTKKHLGYILIFIAVVFAFYRGKRQAYLNCIDFNVMPFITNSITIIICTTLIVTGLVLVKNNHN